MNIAEIISQVCKETHIPMVLEIFGDKGIDAIYEVMDTVRELYKHVDPERICGDVIIFKHALPYGAGYKLPAGPAINFAALANGNTNSLCFEIAADGRAYAYNLGTLKIETLAETSVVYHYSVECEEFLAGTKRKPVLRLDSSARSQFSVPTFSNLRDALVSYSAENVRESTCCIFQQVWFDKNRIFLNGGPESIMRNSMVQFLSNRMGAEHDVWPEQNVNTKNPVDIRVKPRFSSNRLMLIEIKWLGDSVASDGHITAQHRDSRAQKGADQLAGYLDEQRKSAPTSTIQGYYVIIDARREDLPSNAAEISSINKANGLHYENQELTFTPAYHLDRDDFDEPYRMFARPVCCD